MQFGNLPRLSISYPSGATEEEKEQLYWDRLSKGELLPQTPELLPEEDGSLLRTGTGFVAEVGMGEGAKMAGLAAGGPIGYVAGGIIGGVAGSFTRQRIEDPDAPISYGEVVRDTMINLIPFGLGKASKATGLAARVVGSGAVGGVAGAGIGAGGLAVQSMIDEGKLPDKETLVNAGITGGVLGTGLGISGQLASKFYSKYAGKSVNEFNDNLKAGEPTAVAVTEGVNKKHEFELNTSVKGAKKFLLDIKQEVVDRRAYLKDLTDQFKKLIPNFEGSASDVYTVGRTSELKANQALEKLIETHDKDFLALQAAAAKQGPDGYSVEQLHEELNNYMHAKHALEYHKKHLKRDSDDFGVSGKMADGTKMTNREAKKIIAEFEGSKLHESLGESLLLRTDLANNIAKVQREGGLLKGDKLDEYLKYEFYVPLNRQIEKKQFMGRVSGDLKSKGIYARKGSDDDLVVDVYQNIMERNQDAIHRALKNEEGLAMKRMLDQADGALDDVAIVGKRGSITGAIGEGFPDKKGKRRIIHGELRDGDVSVFQGGQQFVIRFADTPYKQIAATLKGIDKAEIGLLTKLGLMGNRGLGSLYTRYNPAFWAPNMVRDRMESFINTAAKIGYRDSFSILNPFEIAGDMRTVWRNLKKGGDVAQNVEDKLYAEFVKNGGSVGGLGMSTRRLIEDNLKAIDMSSKLSDKIKNNGLSKLIDNINAIFEDTTRFSVYKKAKASYSKNMTDAKQISRLALLASRDASFDPQLGGTKIKHLSAAFLFANPAIQGSRNVFRSLKDPKILAGVGASLVGTSMLTDWWNSSIDPDWKNKIKGGPEKSSWRLNKHLIVLFPFQDESGELKYSQVPVPYPLIPLKTVADFTSDLARGRDTDPVALVKEVRDAFIDGYSPTGGTIVPTLLDKAFVAPLLSNKDGLGRDIIPQYMFEMNIPDNQKYGAWMADTYGGQIIIDIAQEVERLGMEVSPETIEYLYENSLGGAGGEIKRFINGVSNLWNGKPVKMNELPIFRRFLGNTYADGFEQLTGITPDISHFEREQNTKSLENSRRHFELLKELRKGSSAEERLQIYENLVQGENKSVQRRLKKSLQDMRLGITKTDRDVRALGVENGMRASFFQKQMSRMTPEQAREYVEDQTRKKIMTPEVKKQMRIAGAFKVLY